MMSTLFLQLILRNLITLLVFCLSSFRGSRNGAIYFIGRQTWHHLRLFTKSTACTCLAQLRQCSSRLLFHYLAQSLSTLYELFIAYFLSAISQSGCHPLNVFSCSPHAWQNLIVRIVGNGGKELLGSTFLSSHRRVVYLELSGGILHLRAMYFFILLANNSSHAMNIDLGQLAT